MRRASQTNSRGITTWRKEELSDFEVSQVMDLLSLGNAALDSGGCLITIDGCLVPGQSRIARFLLDQDRGQFVRTEAAYLELARKVFGSVTSHVRHDLMRVPYTHLITELRP